MQESCMVFESICQVPRFAYTHHVLLFFSKIDLLERTLATSRVDHFFPDFIGSQTDVEAVKLFFRDKFLAVSGENISMCVTSITSTAQVLGHWPLTLSDSV